MRRVDDAFRMRAAWVAAALFTLSAAAQAAPAVAADAPGRETVFTLIVKGGPVMIPIGLASVLALAIAIERFISLRRERVIPPDFMAGLRTAWGTDRHVVAAAIRYCEQTGGAVGSIFKAGLQRIHKGEESIEKAIEDAGTREADKMKRSLRGLSIIASLSTLLGLLGTVYGMISAFQSATIRGLESGGGSEHLARGIYEALVTTAAGLTVAIPVTVLYQVLSAKVDSIIDDLDEMSLEFMASCDEK